MAKKKREAEEEAEAGERWLVSYADMMTLLVALFIVLFAMADVNANKFAALKESFDGHPQAAEALLQGSMSVVEGGSISKLEDSAADNTVEFDVPSVIAAQGIDQKTLQQQAQRQAKADAARQDEIDTLEGVKEEIEASLQASGQSGAVKFTTTSRGLVITVVTDQVLFDVGSATLRAQSDSIIKALGQPLSKVANDISVEGNTDDSPIRTTLYPSNWELSNARATSVARALVEKEGVSPAKVGATGYGQFRPVVPNDTAAHKAQNRRVEVVVLTSLTDSSLTS